MNEVDSIHTAAVVGVRALLGAHVAVAPLAGCVVLDGDPAANEWARCVVLRPGKSYGNPKGPGGAKLLAQRDVHVECRAESTAALNALCEAVSKAANGSVGTMQANGFNQLVQTHTSKEYTGTGYLYRVLVFGAFVTAPPAPRTLARAGETTVSELPPPPKLSKE